jgi:hypothetical protein
MYGEDSRKYAANNMEKKQPMEARKDPVPRRGSTPMNKIRRYLTHGCVCVCVCEEEEEVGFILNTHSLKFVL